VTGDYPLCVATWTIGRPSETFIRRHVQQLLPQRTVVIAHEMLPAAERTWSFDGPVSLYRPSPKRWRQRLQNLAIRFGHVPSDLRDFLRRHGVQVVMSEYLGDFYGLGPAFKHLGIRWYVHLHGHDLSRALRHQPRRILAAHRAADGFIVVATLQRQRLVELGVPPDKIHVVPCGTDLPSPPERRADDGTVRCAAIGRMVAKKAPLLLLDAFRHAATEEPRLRLEYVGGGELLEEASRFVAAHGLAGQVVLHGAQPSEVVKEVLARSDLFLLHSVTAPNGDEEGLPVAILEAMAHGLPVVSTRHAGIPDAVVPEETGLLVAEGDVAGMAAAIVRLARDASLRARLGTEGRRRVEERFTFQIERSRLLRLMGLDPEVSGGSH